MKEVLNKQLLKTLNKSPQKKRAEQKERLLKLAKNKKVNSMLTAPIPSRSSYPSPAAVPGDLWLKQIKKRGKVLLSPQTFEELNTEALKNFCKQNLLELTPANGGYVIKPMF